LLVFLSGKKAFTVDGRVLNAFSSTDERLLGANPLNDVAAKPFIIAAKNAGLKGYDSFMSFIVLMGFDLLGTYPLPSELRGNITARLYIVLYSLGNDGKIGTAEDFFKSYLALPVVLFIWTCG
jgi:amino acid permease